MLINPLPKYGVDFQIGDVVFQTNADSLLSEAIGTSTDKAAWDKGLFVATHTFIITGGNEGLEAYFPTARRIELAPLFLARETLLIIKRPLGQTPESAAEMARLALELEGTPYDTWALAGFALGQNSGPEHANWLEDDDALFCSELVAKVMNATDFMRGRPEASRMLAAWHESRWKPQDLLLCTELWEHEEDPVQDEAQDPAEVV
jgi:hypothetical protein